MVIVKYIAWQAWVAYSLITSLGVFRIRCQSDTHSIGGSFTVVWPHGTHMDGSDSRVSTVNLSVTTLRCGVVSSIGTEWICQTHATYLGRRFTKCKPRGQR